MQLISIVLGLMLVAGLAVIIKTWVFPKKTNDKRPVSG